MSKYKFSHEEANTVNKYGVNISLYGLNNPDVNIVYEEVNEGHFEEFLNIKSTFTWFIVEGEGTFVINNEKIPVVSKDIITVPPNHRIHYFGKMKMILVSTPAFNADNERHIRDIKREESPYFSNNQ